MRRWTALMVLVAFGCQASLSGGEAEERHTSPPEQTGGKDPSSGPGQPRIAASGPRKGTKVDAAKVKEEIKRELLAELRRQAADIKQMKEEIKRELLAELRGQAAPAVDTKKMKAEIKRELMDEMRAQSKGVLTALQALADAEEKNKRLRDDIKEEILAELRQEAKEKPYLTKMSRLYDYRAKGDNPLGGDGAGPRYQGPAGSAEGRILRGGVGLPQCRVKLVLLSKRGSALGYFSSYQEGNEFFAVTDDNGKYTFRNLPVGDYKVKWELPGDKGWIRRIKNKPDVTVRKGETATLKSIETKRKLLSH